VLHMEPMPLAGMFCRSAESARTAPLFPLTWMRCSCCGAVQVAEDISGAQLYEEYNTPHRRCQASFDTSLVSPIF